MNKNNLEIWRTAGRSGQGETVNITFWDSLTGQDRTVELYPDGDIYLTADGTQESAYQAFNALFLHICKVQEEFYQAQAERKNKDE